MIDGLKCLYCGYQMTLFTADDSESDYICDCGAVATDDDFGVYFSNAGENRENWINREFFDGLLGA